MSQEKLQQILNQQVANWTILYMKLHNYHWYVKGPHFFELHEKFEELYDEGAAYLDDLAERLLSIGGKPIGTLKEALELATIQEAEGELDANGMVQSIIDDYKKLTEELREGIEVASSLGDESTTDLFIGINTDLEKHIWMLSAFLGK